jgi:plasmid maintenance system killer protein
MRVEFADRQLQRCYEDQALAVRRWGMDVTRKFVLRLDMIEAAPHWHSLSAVQALRLHPLTGNRRGSWALTLHGRWRLILHAVDDGTMVVIEEVSNHYGD